MQTAFQKGNSAPRGPEYHTAKGSVFVIVTSSLAGQRILQGLDALGADVLPVIDDHVLGVVTEDAGGLILLQHDGRTIHVNFQGILFRNVQGAAQLNREYDTA